MQTITKELFERYVPAFRTPSDAYGDEENTVWAALQTHLQTAADDVAARYGPDLPDAVDTQEQRLLCLMAARRAMAGADLVLTQTGFGVVRNQNLTPASRERVQALAEELRREESRADDALAMALMTQPEWCDTPQAVCMADSLLWCPTLMRRYGVTAPGGSEVYAEEHRALLQRLRMAEQKACSLISPELMSALIRRQRTEGGDTDPDYILTAEKARRFMAAHIMQDQRPRAVRPMGRDLLDYVRSHADSLPEWGASAVREAQEAPSYENTKSDPCFFF